VVLSHRDSDHTGGAAAVLTMQPQANLLSSIEDDNALQALRPATRCVSGQRWRWDGVDFEVLHPQADDYGPVHKTNAMSCVLRIANGQRTALLVGDIEQAQEARLVDALAARSSGGVSGLHADVLLVPHHGSKTSSSAGFLDAVAPGFALVQNGYHNRFGHPAQPVRERYQQRNIMVLDLPHCGAMSWNSAAPDAVSCLRQTEPHYWQHHVP
jgi:competence protein ComEC